MVKFVQLATGESVPCDLVIVAIGSETCTELLKDSPIEMTPDDFIRVNDRLETSVENVLAVGDITKYPLRIFNLEEVNCQHWQMACSTGHQAGKKIEILILFLCLKIFIRKKIIIISFILFNFS